MIKYEKIIEYYNMINEIMAENEMQGYYRGFNNPLHEEIFFIGINDENEKYAILNPNIDLKKAWSDVVGRINTNILVAAEREKALEIIGLAKNDELDIIPIAHKQKIKKK